MSKRLTIEFVRKKFAERGYTLLGDTYINAHQKLEFKCNVGHIHTMSYANFKKGSRCMACFRKYNADSCRMDFDVIKESFRKEGYKILTKEYKSCTQKLEYICPVGHRHSVCWSAWKTGNRCAFCAGQVLSSINEIRQSFESYGYILLSNKCEHGDKKLNYICDKGHRWSISWNSWKQGSRCPICFRLRSKNKIEDIRKSFKDRGYTLLSTEYKNALSYLDYICPKGHKHLIKWNSFQQGHGCPICAIDIIKKKKRTPIKDIIESFKKENYTLLSKEYKRASQKLEFKCSNGHLHSITWSHWNQGTRCIKCYLENNNGSNNPNWKGGIATSPYCSVFKNKEWREYIYDRDKDKFCWNPICENKGTKKSLHHIDYDKKNCDPFNIIKLCNSCNSIANADRDWWQGYYTETMRRRFI